MKSRTRKITALRIIGFFIKNAADIAVYAANVEWVLEA